MSLAHATAAAVTVVAGATVLLPLHHHNCRRLQLLQTLGSWSGPCPLPSIDRLIGRWSPLTMTPLDEVIKATMCHPLLGPLP
jgi:hypothetical protein